MKKTRNSLRRWLMKVLPKAFSHAILRNLVNLQPEPPGRLKFKVADSIGELAASFRLLHEGFVREGYMLPTASGFRVTPYHFLPDTLVVSVLDGPDTVATVSIFSASSFGLPLESQFDLEDLLARLPKAVEISSLAVSSAHSGNHGELLFPLMKFAYHCNHRVLEAQLELVGVHPKMVPLYEAILLYQPVEGAQPRSYDFVNGAPVVPLYFDLTTAEEQFKRVYQGKAANKNLQDYFLGPIPASFTLPENREFFRQLPQNRPETLRKLMALCPEATASMTPLQWEALERLQARNPGCAEVVQAQRALTGDRRR